MQADGNFRHRQTAVRCDDTDRCALQQSHAAAHDIAVAPAQQWLGVVVHQVDEAVLVGEEAFGQCWHDSGRRSARLGQAANVTTCAECLYAVSTQQHADNIRVGGPASESIEQRFNHRQAQGVELLRRVQRGYGNPCAM